MPNLFREPKDWGKIFQHELEQANERGKLDVLARKPCVVEAIETVVNTCFTREQKLVRAEQLIQGASTDEEAFNHVVELIDKVRSQLETPAGGKLARLSIRQTQMTATQIRQTTRTDKQVVVVIPPTDHHEAHMAKVTPKSGRAFMQNFGFEPDLHLQEGKPYRVIVFEEKE